MLTISDIHTLSRNPIFSTLTSLSKIPPSPRSVSKRFPCFRFQISKRFSSFCCQKHPMSSSSSSSSVNMVAEYAKSNRSSCKKCQETISAKALRLGLVSRDSRGFDMTRWHHLDCFPMGSASASVTSAEAIMGFASLESNDQEALKKLVGQRDKSLEESNDQEALKKLVGQRDKSVEENEDLELLPVKIIAEYAKSNRSSCKKCQETISAKALRLGLVSRDSHGFDMTRWHHLDCFPMGSGSVSVTSAETIMGFASLESNDQEALKKLVGQCDKSPEENEDLELLPVKIVAEYAKSNRSSCRKCQETISAKALRLGLVSSDSRGFDMTRWHHLDCFPMGSGSVSVTSPEAIMGFASLESNDQEALKKLVGQCDKSLEEDFEGGKDIVEGSKGKSSKQLRVHKTDGDEKNERDERNSKKAKLSTPNEEAVPDIDFSVSDIKNNYKDATLLPEWKAFQTVIFLERDDGLHDSKKIAAFDFDGCLAKTSVKRAGPDAWSLMYPSIPDKLRSLYNDGYKLVIFTNESNIERWKNKRQLAVDSKIGRLNNFIKHVKVPIQVFIACGLGKSGGQAEDPFRKPKPGMWQLMEQHFNSGILIDLDRSFYVGDAAGRKDDHSDADIKFAKAIGLKFHVPEEYFSA